MLKKVILPNGLKIIFLKTPGKAVTIQCTVFSGSNAEEKKQAGISHFLEHMLFEGTTAKPDAQIISNEIERLGGEFNASTENEYVSYYVTLQNKHMRIALDVIADIYKNTLIAPEKVEKERKVIMEEVKMIDDNPRSYQMILFEKNIFSKHPLKNPIYGNIEVLKKITRDELFNYYKKLYVPNNTLITVVGNVPDPTLLIKQHFKALLKKKLPAQKVYHEPSPQRKVIRKNGKQKQDYLTLGWRTVSAKHQDIFVLDVIAGILGRGQSGRLFDEIRGKRGLCYNVGVFHNYISDIGYFAVYCANQKQNTKKVIKLILEEMKRLQALTVQDLNDAKTYLEGDLVVKAESTQYIADELTFWEKLTKAEDFNKYIAKIKKVTVNDVKRVAKKYFTSQYTLAILE